MSGILEIKYTTIRPNTTVLFTNPDTELDIIELLGNAYKRRISVDQTFSDDGLTTTITWWAPNEDIWEEYSSKYLSIDTDWETKNNLVTTIEKRFVPHCPNFFNDIIG